MLAEGNSAVEPCARNLLSAMQREIPFSRSKGIDPDVYDVPFGDVAPFLDESARETLTAYEPRINVDNVDLQFWQVEDEDGTYFTVDITDREGDINDEDDEGDDD